MGVPIYYWVREHRRPIIACGLARVRGEPCLASVADCAARTPQPTTCPRPFPRCPSPAAARRTARASAPLPHCHVTCGTRRARRACGLQHGFRKAENIQDALNSEYYFFSRVFGFVPAGDDIVPFTIDNLGDCESEDGKPARDGDAALFK